MILVNTLDTCQTSVYIVQTLVTVDDKAAATI